MSIEYLRLDGSTPMKDRQKSAKLFNAGACYVFLISTEAGGLGLNLFGANRVIIFDFRWSPMWEQQAIGRAYRLGQTKHVFVYRFRSGGTLQDKMWNSTQFKSQLTTRVVDNKATVREAIKNTHQYLKEPTPVQQQDLSVFLGKDKVLDRLISENDYIRAVEHTETFMPDIEDVLNEDEQKEVDELLKQNRAMREQGAEARAAPPSLPASVPRPIAPPTSAPWQTAPLPSAPQPTAPPANAPQPTAPPSSAPTTPTTSVPRPIRKTTQQQPGFPSPQPTNELPPPPPPPPQQQQQQQQQQSTPQSARSLASLALSSRMLPKTSKQAGETKRMLETLNQTAQQRRVSAPILSGRQPTEGPSTQPAGGPSSSSPTLPLTPGQLPVSNRFGLPMAGGLPRIFRRGGKGKE